MYTIKIYLSVISTNLLYAVDQTNRKAKCSCISFKRLFAFICLWKRTRQRPLSICKKHLPPT